MADRSVAVVTGAGQGIGRAIALRLAADGMDVVVVDRQGEAAERVAGEVRAGGRTAVVVAGDITDTTTRDRMVAAAVDGWGGLDVLVNNAGTQRLELPAAVTEEHWDTVMGVNAKATYFACVAGLTAMSARGHGCVVNIASAAGKTASTVYHPVYNVSKAAVLAMTRTFAYAYAAAGIRVNAVCPGLIDTPMQDAVDAGAAALLGVGPATVGADRLARVPMGRKGLPEEVAGVVSFLVGPDAAYMTGQALNVTGGMVMY
jgi:meso-butanediol dehydrogenase / (S,S)-butanediol dehydrogenase / diacetyl reductase